jgi:hypothetical protein
MVPGVVERDDVAGCGQGVDEAGVPVLQVAAEVLEQDHGPAVLGADPPVGVADVVRAGHGVRRRLDVRDLIVHVQLRS